MLHDRTPRTNSQTLTIMLAVIVPPLAVYQRFGLSREFWINVVLTLLGFFPGMLHAVFLSLKRLRVVSPPAQG
jgi:uncharacterized membrane protein YqaE (UPF0057 family)